MKTLLSSSSSLLYLTHAYFATYSCLYQTRKDRRPTHSIVTFIRHSLSKNHIRMPDQSSIPRCRLSCHLPQWRERKRCKLARGKDESQAHLHSQSASDPPSTDARLFRPQNSAVISGTASLFNHNPAPTGDCTLIVPNFGASRRDFDYRSMHNHSCCQQD